MGFLKAAGAALLLVGLGACTPEMAGSRPVDGEFKVSEINWDSGGAFVVAYKAVEDNGTTLVCGAWATQPGGNAALLNRQLVRTVRVVTADGTLISDLSFMPQAASPSALSRSQASCARTDTPWRPAYGNTRGIGIRMGQRTFEVS
ncbi:MAG: hypothetical protein AAGE18_12445 [Pseudomonadota bacterium]